MRLFSLILHGPSGHPAHPPLTDATIGMFTLAAGLAHRLTQQWALAGINLQGLTMAVMKEKFVGFAAFDSVTDANRAAQILADLGAAGN